MGNEGAHHLELPYYCTIKVKSYNSYADMKVIHLDGHKMMKDLNCSCRFI